MTYHAPNISRVAFSDAIMRVGEQHLRDRGFIRVTVPRIVPASGACENVDTLFEIGVDNNPRWFSGGTKRAYFAQTGQLYLESLLGSEGIPKLYCVGPSARAENEVDTRHLTEFEMIEIEFRGSFDELLHEMEDFINALVDWERSVPQNKRTNFGLPKDMNHLETIQKQFPRIKYKDAVKELDLEWGDDISSSKEKELIANHGKGPIFITHYPNPESERMKELFAKKKNDLAIKFFNMIPDPKDPDHVQSCDCIVPFGGECIGSAARVYIHDEFKSRLYNSLMFKRLLEKDSNAAEGFSWYLETLQCFPSVPHVGCGFGMSRIAQYLLAETDITKVVVLPSNKERLY